MIEEVDSEEEPEMATLTLKEQLAGRDSSHTAAAAGPAVALTGDATFDRGKWGGMYDIDEDEDDAAETHSVADTDTYTEGGQTDGGWTTATSDAGVDETCVLLPRTSLCSAPSHS
jgi:hypothetical protein